MRSSLIRIAIAATLASCTANIHDNDVSGTANIDLDHVNVDVTSSVDVNNVQAGMSVPLNLTVDSRVLLIEPSAQPPANRVDVAAHFQIYLDNVDGEPILVTASTQAEVKIPSSAPPGPHTLICRLHHHDGRPTSSRFEVKINVKVSISTGSLDGGAGGGGAGGGGAGG